MNLRIVSPYGVVFDDEIYGFSIETNSGKRVIMDRHNDFVAFYQYSEVKIINEHVKDGVNASGNFFVALGYLYISEGQASLVAQLASKSQKDIETTYQKLLQIRKGSQDAL